MEERTLLNAAPVANDDSYNVGTQAMSRVVLGNLEQPPGASAEISPIHWFAEPFTVNKQTHDLTRVDLPTVIPTNTAGGFFMEIWDADFIGQPDSKIAILSGNSNPAGAESYTGNVRLSPDTTYYAVTGVRNLGGQYLVSVTNSLKADPGQSTWSYGSDFTGDGKPDTDSTCQSTSQGSHWSCGGAAAASIRQQYRITATRVDPAAASITGLEADLAFASAEDAASDRTLSVNAPGVLENDTDSDGDKLTVASVNGMDVPQNGLNVILASGANLSIRPNGSFSYIAAAGFSGNDSFTYLNTDGELLSNEATVTIEVPEDTTPPANQAPVAKDDSYHDA
jgi:hypothetical protein